jgi:hypothetical protein
MRLLFAVLTISGGLVGLTAAIFTLLPSSLGAYAGGLGAGVVSIASLAIATVAVTYSSATLRSSRQQPMQMRVALAGAPRAGKTVYANVLYELLLDGRGPSSVSFAAETKSAQSVLRAIKRLSIGEWPVSTTWEGIFRYRGLIIRQPREPFARMLLGKDTFDFELGDSAGEVWAELAEEYRGEGPPSIIESTFFDYISESNVIFCFVDAGQMRDSAEATHAAVEDLISALLLLKATKGTSIRMSIPVALLVSKADLLSEDEASAVRSVFVTRDTQPSRVTVGGRKLSEEFVGSLNQVERLYATIQRLTSNSEAFLLSSADAAVDARMADARSLGLTDHDSREPQGYRNAVNPILWATAQVRARGARSAR